MNKQSFITTLLTVLMCMTGAKAFAYDIAVANNDGVTIYYDWANNNTELAVSYRNWSSSNNYTGDVVIPESVEYNGNTYPVTSIGYHAFFDCSGLTSLTIPNSVTSIGDYAFWGCSGLTSVTIPNSVTSIGSSAFSGCSGLTSVKVESDNPKYDSRNNCNAIIETSSNTIIFGCMNTTIPNSVTSIGEYAFSSCSGLTSVTIPNSVTSIGMEAFYGCRGLTSVTIPNSVTSIGKFAFYGCSSLTSVVIGSGVTNIGEGALNYANLKKIIWLTNTPPTGYYNDYGVVNYVSNNQFSFYNQVKYQFLSSYFDVDGIRYVPVSPSEKTCDAIDCVYDERATNTRIASTVVYKGVTMMVKNIKPYFAYNNNYIKTLSADNDGELAHNSFANCSNLTSVTLGKKVSKIGIEAFCGCSSIKRIDIPDIVTELNERTFSGCTSLKDIKIGSNVKTIYEYALSECSALLSITIPSSVTTINSAVFYNCTSLKNVVFKESEAELNLGSNVKGDEYGYSYGNPLFSSCPLDSVYIGRNINYHLSPFSYNLSLRAVKFADKETEISENEFYGCTNLQKITIGDGVTTIGKRAFSGCSSLKFFAFGSQVAEIGEEAFSDCAAIVEISSKAKAAPACGSQALDDINKWECKLYVPDGCIAAYEAADQWKDFFFKEEGEGTASYGDNDEEIVMKCETPTITLVGDKLSFACATDGVTYYYSVSYSDVKSGTSSKDVDLTKTYTITVFARKDGYGDSEVAKATFKAVPGDVNGDGKVDVTDHVKLSDIIMDNSGQHFK